MAMQLFFLLQENVYGDQHTCAITPFNKRLLNCIGRNIRYRLLSIRIRVYLTTTELKEVEGLDFWWFQRAPF